jgi:beta-mannosidase
MAGENVTTLEIESRGHEASGQHYEARATLRIRDVRPWMPHTHGEPNLYPLRAEFQLKDGSTAIFEDTPVGFRSIDAGVDVPGDEGLALKINGTPIFCRGVVWTPPDAASLTASPAVVRERLQLLRDGGFNLIRVAGTTVYEDEAFHCLCDELGLLVWQDMMFANMNYPYEDSSFRDTVREEAEAELSRLGRHASLAIICGNSEIEQQVGMLGLSAEMGRGTWFGRDLPQIARTCCPGVPYVPSAPCGGDSPFRTRRGIANYFGVGAYLRSLEDVRRAEVQFASECLAFANVPEPEVIDKMARAIPGGVSPTHPVWKRGVPRDSGASWDFEDVRDHYLKLLHSVDATALRSTDCNRYWELSRMVSGEVMGEVFGEWRRPESPCSGGIVLWAADLEPGAGWGILDFQGRPKSAYWFLKRALAARSVWTTDEGLNGIDVHVANDGSERMDSWLRVALYRAGEQRVGQSELAVSVPKHQAVTFGLEQILGRFVDAAYAYRFGPPGQDVVVCSLHKNPGDIPFAQAFRYPAGRPTGRIAISELGISGEARALSDGRIEVLLTSRRLEWGVRVTAPGYLPDDAYFDIEPGGRRRIVMTRLQHGDLPASLGVTATNAEGRMSVAIGGGA